MRFAISTIYELFESEVLGELWPINGLCFKVEEITSYFEHKSNKPKLVDLISPNCWSLEQKMNSVKN